MIICKDCLIFICYELILYDIIDATDNYNNDNDSIITDQENINTTNLTSNDNDNKPNPRKQTNLLLYQKC